MSTKPVITIAPTLTAVTAVQLQLEFFKVIVQLGRLCIDTSMVPARQSANRFGLFRLKWP